MRLSDSLREFTGKNVDFIISGLLLLKGLGCSVKILTAFSFPLPTDGKMGRTEGWNAIGSRLKEPEPAHSPWSMAGASPVNLKCSSTKPGRIKLATE